MVWGSLSRLEGDSAVATTRTLSLFGAPRLTDAEGREVALPKKAYLLALRLVEERLGMRLDRDVAAQFLWPEHDLDGRRANLRTLLKRIRAAQAAAGVAPIVIAARWVAFDASAVDCDAAAAFAALRGRNVVELARLAQTASRPLLETGDPEFVETTVWLWDVRSRFVADFIRLGRAALSASALERAPEARRALALGLIALDSCDELAYRALMSAAAARGDSDEALASFDQLTGQLRRRDGRLPSPETCALRDRLAAPREQTAELSVAALRPSAPDRLPPLLLVSGRALAATDSFPRLADDLGAQLWRGRSVRVAVCDPATPSPDPCAQNVYRVHVSQRQAAALATIRLTFEGTQEIVWAHSYALTHETADAVVATATAAMLDRVERHQIDLSEAAGESDPSTFLMLAKANRDLKRADLPSIRRARRRFRDVFKQDECCARAYAGAARGYWLDWLMRAGPDQLLLDSAGALARKAVEIDPDDPFGHREMGMVASYRRRHQEALTSLERAVALAPEHPGIKLDMADALFSCGARREAMRQIEAAERAGSGGDDIASWMIATGLYLDEQYAAALEKLSTMQAQDSTWRLRLLCHAQLGQHEKTRLAVVKTLEFQPDFDPESWARVCPISEPADREHILDGLRIAGLG